MNTLKALLLLALSAYLAVTIISGRLYYYIGPRFAWMAVLSVGLLVLPALAYLWTRRHSHAHDHADDHEHRQTTIWTLLIVAVPLVLGIVVPPKPLGASSIGNRGFSNDAATSSDTLKTTNTIAPEQRNILDWVRAIHAGNDPHALDDQPVDVVGFVYKSPTYRDNQFMVARLTIVCCVADAAAIGLAVETPNANLFEPDSWVRVKGKFTAGTLDDNPTPVIVADEVTQVDAPQQPYLYP